jgi:signal transduction histidine kinase
VATRISEPAAAKPGHRPQTLAEPAVRPPGRSGPLAALGGPSPGPGGRDRRRRWALPGLGPRRGAGLVPSLVPGQAGTASLAEERSRRRALLGRLAAVFYLGSGLLGLATLPLPAPDSNRLGTTLVASVALAVGAAAWLAPWGRWPRRATLWLVPPAFALIAFANAFGGTDLRAYGVFFVVAFVWIGFAQPPRTALLVAPLAAAAYIVPLLWMPGHIGAGLPSAATTLPLCVLVGEGIAWGMGRLDRIERALHAERDRSGELRELDRLKDAFLSAVSHELRTPLTICRGHLDVLGERPAKDEVRAVRQTLTDELDLMGRLVEDLTTLARGGDGMPLKMESLPLRGFLASIVAMAEPILGGRLEVAAGPAGATLWADPQRLTQGLLNMLQNAAGHARGGGPVSLRVRAEPVGWRFEVADEGGGLPPGEERFVFEPFRTGSSATGRTGLGLAIVRGIARAHGGDCGVLNRPGRGATFWIWIPR